MKSRKTLSNWLTNRYLLIIRNEENFAEKSTFSFNYAKLIVFFVSIFIIFLTVSLYLSKTILAQWVDPRHAELETNKKLIALSMAIDSLAVEVDKKDKFIKSFQYVLTGDGEAVDYQNGKSDSEQLESLNREIDIYSLHDVDSAFRKEFEESGEGILRSNSVESQELQEIFFFSPVSGIVSSPYNAKGDHYGIDIVSKSNEPIKTVADGTVILSNWTQETGYVIAVQHRSNLISIYKHNSALLKKEGNFVRAGDLIAIIGNSGELTSGPHLHFELWHNGNPVDPEAYISL